MFKIAICDDNLEFLETISNIVENISIKESYDFEIERFTSANDLLENKSLLNFSCAFIDIEMPFMSGFELAKELQNKHAKIHIVFVSNKNHLVFESLSYHPFSFIRKSHLEEEMIDRLNILHEIFIKEKSYIIKLYTTNGLELINMNDVIYVEKAKNYIIIHLIDDKIIVRKSLSQAEKEWKSYKFIRIHSGYLINIKHIKQYQHTKITLTTNCSLPISRSREKEVQLKIKEELFNEH